MGIFDKILGQFIDVIEWVDESRDTLVWKFPDTDKEIKNGAQLTVRESQSAILINEGAIGDVYAPGRHELSTRNMPIMTTLKSWKYGFDSPFKVDVYFVNTNQFTLKWGTPQPILVPDPEFQMVQLRAFGSFVFKIKDPRAFFTNCAGTDPHVTTGEIMERLRGTVLTEFSGALNTLAKAGMQANQSFLVMLMDMQSAGPVILEKVAPDFTSIGIEALRFNIESVTLPEEVQAAINEQNLSLREKRKTNEIDLQRMMGEINIADMMKDPQKFMQMKAAMGMNQPGGDGGNSDMAKMMMQMQMAQQMMQNMNTPQTQQTQSAGGGEAVGKEQVMTMLKDLGDLKAAGILTEEEFNAKKAELLARL